MKILSNKEYEKIINEKPQSSTYTYYMKDPYQAKKIDELENQNIKLEIESDKKDKEIERLNSIINELEKYIRSNEWGIDYEHSNCRTHLLDILEGSDK